MGFCIFQQMQLSSDASTLYLISPVYATSGSMAIVSLRQGSVTYVRGVNLVYLIETGPHRDELIYWRRVDSANGPRYPLVHASKTGKPIAEIQTKTSRSQAITARRSCAHTCAKSVPQSP